MRIAQLAVSPCCLPEMALDEILAAYAGLGYCHFEVFTTWVESRFDYHGDPQFYLAKGRANGVSFSSLHLPPVAADRQRETLREAIAAAQFAAAIGVEVVLYKASDRATYIAAAPAFLDAIDELGLTPVIQNHCGSPLTTLADVREVFDGVADPRLHTLLEVGHFHAAGVPWREAVESLADSIALVHIKDQVGRQSVPFGAGEIDLPALVEFLDERRLSGPLRRRDGGP